MIAGSGGERGTKIDRAIKLLLKELPRLWGCSSLLDPQILKVLKALGLNVPPLPHATP